MQSPPFLLWCSLVCALPLGVVAGCGGDGGAASTPDAAVAYDAGPPDAPATAACYPTGIYGKCGETGCPNCLNGANMYQVCASSCTQSSDCGDAADFDGATPLCAPLNPRATQMICVLTCTSTDQCPCGLECRASGVQGVNICAETL